MCKAHTADDARGIIFDGRHAVGIVWVLALGDQIVNEYSIEDHTRTVDEGFQATFDFNLVKKLVFVSSQ